MTCYNQTMKILAVIIAIVAAFVIGNYVYTSQVCGVECQVGDMLPTITSISATEFNQQVQADEATLIDIRTAEEYTQGHVVSAVNQDFYQTVAFSSYLDSLDKDASYLIYCRSGNRSGQALEIMRQKGFTHVSDLSGGITAWQSAGYSLE